MNMELALKKMLHQQEMDNELFKNMPIERIDDVITLILPPEDIIISKTVIVANNGMVILRRFIDRKLWSISFANGLGIGVVIVDVLTSLDTFVLVLRSVVET